MGDEEARLLAYLQDECFGQRNPYFKSLFIFAIETASRRSEMVRLQWSDVDLKRRTALLRDTKNGQNREIGLSTRAVEALIAIPRSKDGRVFPISTNAVRQAWDRVVARCGISGLKFHDLRHEGASRLCERLNGDVIALSAMTGHKSLQMLKRYTHPRAEDLARRLG
jgi:integrase